MRLSTISAGIAAVCTLGPLSMGQSLNIRFGTVASTPSSTYSAAGLPGVWNSFQVTPGYAPQSLVSLQGTPVTAQYYQYGNASILAFDNPLTAGDDEKLMDSMMLSTNNPVDGCFWVQGLTLGQYEVTIYAMTPNSSTLLNRTRVDNGTPGPVMVGGTWPGHHQSTQTFARFTVTTTDGVIAFHDGLYGGVVQSGMNGVQLRFLGSVGTPYCSGDGTDAPCPCANPGLIGRGCNNTVSSGGALLLGSGVPSISSDTLVLNGSHANPFGPGLYYQGSAPANVSAPFGVAFGNGLACAGGSTPRLEIRTADGTGASATTVAIHNLGADTAGNVRYYQLWYRDSPNFGSCTSGFNLSNAISLTWIP